MQGEFFSMIRTLQHVFVLGVCFSLNAFPAYSGTVLYSGSRDVRLRSCGCVGKNLGGIEREGGMVNFHHASGDGMFLYVDAGGFWYSGEKGSASGDDRTTISLCLSEIYNRLPADAVNFGVFDCIAYEKSLSGMKISDAFRERLVSANLMDCATSAPVVSPYKIFDDKLSDGRKFKTAVIGVTRNADGLSSASSGRIAVEDSVVALHRVLPAIREQKCDYIIVLAYMERNNRQVDALAKELSGYGIPCVVICGDVAGEPCKDMEVRYGVSLVSTGHSGKHLGKLDISTTNSQVTGNTLLDVDDSYPPSPRVTEILHKFGIPYNETLSTRSLQKINLF